MATTCKATGTILEGDAVCVIGYDTVNARPDVGRATATALATSKTVFGVARADAAAGVVVIRVAGEVAEDAISDLGVGGSRIVATDVGAATDAEQCRLVRVDRPDGSEHVVGTCNEDGDVAILPRASRDTSPYMVFNVAAYGPTGFGADEGAILAAASAAAVEGGTLFFPAGTYVTSPDTELTIPENVEVHFARGAAIEPNLSAVRFLGPIRCAENQRIFGGTGFMTDVVPSRIALSAVSASGTPRFNYDVVVFIGDPDNPPSVPPPAPVDNVPVTVFRYALDGAMALETAAIAIPTGGTYTIPGTGITIGFAAGTYYYGDTYTFSTRAPVILGPRALPNLSVVNFGAVPYDSESAAAVGTDSAPFIQACLDAIPSAPGLGMGQGARVLVPAGVYRTSSTLDIGRALVLRGAGSHRYGEVAARTVVLVDDGVTAIRTWHAGMGWPNDFRADGCTIEDMMFKARGHSVPGAYGLRMHTCTYVHRTTFEGFSSHGIYIDTTIGGSTSNWQLHYSRSTMNGGDGLRTQGNESNNGLALGFDSQGNKGYGVYEDSLLGATYVSCHTADNLKGPFCQEEPRPGASTFIGCHHEADQPPNVFEGNNLTVIGGYGEAGQTPRSHYFGGYDLAAESTTFLSRLGPPLAAAGTSPPTVRLRGWLLEATVDVRIEITTAGYPGGRDAWGEVMPDQAEYRWSIDGGTTYTGPVPMPRADDVYNSGLASFELGTTGLSAVFTPGYYSTDNVWTGSASNGGLPAFFRAGSRDNANMAFSFGHANIPHPTTDAGYQCQYNPSTLQWEYQWGGSGYFVNMHMSGGNALPRAGHVSFDDGVWFGTTIEGYNRITGARADYAVGATEWLRGTGSDTGLVGWFSAGDLVLNRSEDIKFPVAWRATESGGFSANVNGVDVVWQGEAVYTAGDSVRPTAGPDMVYRALNRGLAGDTEPAWPTTRGDTVVDNEVTWQCVGPHGASIIEPLLTQSELMGTLDVTTPADPTLVQAQFERLKLDGAPPGPFDLTFPAGPAGGFLRVIWNGSTEDATIKGSAGDTGVVVPAGAAYQILSDGTNCVRVQ